MVLAVDSALETIRRVTDSAAQAWSRTGATVVETPLAALTGVACRAPALVVADEGVVECVADGDFGPIGSAVRRLAAEGWRVAVLAPASQMGSAHRALRGVPARIQPWWTGSDDSVLFGVPEVP
jgi:hypothetical protein